MRRWFNSTSCIWAQALVVLGTLLAIVFIPSSKGTMLLIPMMGISQASVVNHAIAAGARISGAGPLSGSLLVEGDRGRMLAAALPAGIIVLRAPAILCGEKEGRAG